MRASCCLFALVMLVPRAVRAQTTADGVQALVRGDYATAARILRPLAEDAPEPDPLAVFFMATLYQAGLGVATDYTRACGLYLRAAATPTNPLLIHSLELAQMIYQDSPIMREQCSAASVNRWRDPPAAVFSLGPDHWVQIDHRGFVVGYKGTQKKAAMSLGGPSWVFLPTRHTQMDVVRPVAVRRHFIAFLIWVPHTVSDHVAWSLLWWAYEIVGADTIAVPGDGVLLATITGTQPPASFADEDLPRIRVNADGEAEWVVSGATPRSGVIPYAGSR